MEKKDDKKPKKGIPIRHLHIVQWFRLIKCAIEKAAKREKKEKKKKKEMEEMVSNEPIPQDVQQFIQESDRDVQRELQIV